MSLFKKALGAFVELDEKKAPDPIERLDPPTRVSAAPTSTKLSVVDVEKFEAHFDALFEQSNLPGPDYFEFSKTVEAMEADIPQEGARMKAAFTALRVQGVTKDALISTARQYIAIVDADRKALEAQVEEKTRTEIAPLASAWKDAEDEVTADEEQIRKLQAGLDAKRRAAQEANQKVVAAKERLGANIEGYQTACTAMVARIEQDILTITNIL